MLRAAIEVGLRGQVGEWYAWKPPCCVREFHAMVISHPSFYFYVSYPLVMNFSRHRIVPYTGISLLKCRHTSLLLGSTNAVGVRIYSRSVSCASDEPPTAQPKQILLWLASLASAKSYLI